jgi:PHD/YefM family antitoxin component YafN of YafNO toxin-antitoxin module
MIQTPQIEPVTQLVKNHKGIFAKLEKGPVFLAQRSRTAAVMLSPAQWDEMTAELSRLRRIIEGDRQLAEMHAGNYVTVDTFDKLGVIDAPGSTA